MSKSQKLRDDKRFQMKLKFPYASEKQIDELLKKEELKEAEEKDGFIQMRRKQIDDQFKWLEVKKQQIEAMVSELQRQEMETLKDVQKQKLMWKERLYEAYKETAKKIFADLENEAKRLDYEIHEKAKEIGLTINEYGRLQTERDAYFFAEMEKIMQTLEINRIIVVFDKNEGRYQYIATNDKDIQTKFDAFLDYCKLKGMVTIKDIDKLRVKLAEMKKLKVGEKIEQN